MPITHKALLFSLLALASCTTTPTASGLYLQVRHPLNGVPVLQITLPTEEGCGFLLRSMLKNEKTKDAGSLSRCVDSSISQELPTKAILFDKTYRYSLYVETVAPTVCEQMVRDILKGSPPDSVAVNVPCSLK